MTKIINLEAEIKACEESIEHWNKDIANPLREGYIIKIDDYGDLEWGDIELLGSVKTGGEHCPLCQLHPCIDCSKCSLKILSGISCCDNGSPYANFMVNPILENAEEMILALKAVLNQLLQLWSDTAIFVRKRRRL